MSDKYEFKRLNAIRNGDGSEVREQLIYAGLLLTIFERFKVYVVDHVDGFFSDHVEINGGGSEVQARRRIQAPDQGKRVR